jgi:hypothetical protein
MEVPMSIRQRRASMVSVAVSAAAMMGWAGLGCIPGVGDEPGPTFVDPPFPPVRVGPPPVFESPISAARPPAPLSGGTLAVLADGRTAVAADPDRDSIFVVDYRKQTLLATITLQPGDEPGRVAEDSAGRVHVALRRGGALITLQADATTRAWAQVGRRTICAAPRGIAHDKTRDLLYVACAEGQLVSLQPAADGAVTRRLELESDLRDVVVDGDVVLVSRFRSAEVITVDADGGGILARKMPPSRSSQNFNRFSPSSGAPASQIPELTTMAPSVAWRMVSSGPGETFVVHQRGVIDAVTTQPGGYAGAGCGGIVETAVTNVGVLSSTLPSPAVMGAVLPVDIALSADRKSVALIAAGNARQQSGGFGGQQLQVLPAQALTATGSGECTGAGVGTGAGTTGGGMAGSTGGEDPMTGGTGGAPGSVAEPGDILVMLPSAPREPIGEAVAVGFDPRGHILVQTREPASIQIVTAPAAAIVLSRESRVDTGHGVFHANSGGGLACASCHPEGADDGRVWKFFAKDGKTVQVRRTQNLLGGVLATAPFHWAGDLRDVDALMDEVFVTRMGGPRLDRPYIDVLKSWMDKMPSLPHAAPADLSAPERGRALFSDATVGCTKCHTGDMWTNNTTVDVGTGGPFQVPSLRGIGWRAPYMHDGCATTLKARFTGPCGGGDKHGVTSKLTPAQIDDLVAFLETL